jgi:acetyl-CoA synthetase
MERGTERYEQLRREHRWQVPARYNIAADVCDSHEPDALAMVHEHYDGTTREVRWGELQALANQAANLLAGLGVGRGDRVAVVLPPTPETAAVFFATWKLGAILLSMSVLYGDEGIAHRAWAAGICPLLGPWRHGAVQLVYQREGGFDPHRQLDFLSRHRASNVFATPTAIRSMMAITDARERYPQQFRVVCSAGEPLNPEAIRWFRDQYGVTVLDYYGLTESYPLCGNMPWMGVREGSMGRPLPGWDVAILDEDERPVAQGERGEICLRARSNPHYPLGYWRLAEASEETFGGEWFHSKDAARMDADGYVWYEGRADDVIIAAGYRIGPFEVESCCLEHPAVAEAAAVAAPDERRGAVVMAYVVPAAGHTPSPQLGEEIQAFVRERLSAYAYPRIVEFVPDLPKTLTGKIRRIELRERAQLRAGSAAG